MTSRLGGGPNAEGDRLAAFGMANRDKFRLAYIIWNMKIASATRGWNWRPYLRYGPNPGNTLGHRDHNHWSFKADQGGLLRSGGTAVNLSGRPERVLPPRETIVYEKLLAALLRMEQRTGGQAYGVQGGRTGPLVHVERVESTVDLELIARQAEFRERAGAFT